jgi:hypothetical protein
MPFCFSAIRFLSMAVVLIPSACAIAFLDTRGLRVTSINTFLWFSANPSTNLSANLSANYCALSAYLFSESMREAQRSTRGSYSSMIRTLPGSLPLVSSSRYSSNRFLISAVVMGEPPDKSAWRRSSLFIVTLISPDSTSESA